VSTSVAELEDQSDHDQDTRDQPTVVQSTLMIQK